jgi:hypothetical protein
MPRAHKTKSSLGHCYLIKFLPVLALGGAVAVAVIVAIHGTDYFTDGEGYPSLAEMIFVAVFLLAVIHIGFYFAVVEARDEGLDLRRNGKTKLKEWKNVKAIRQISFCTPPVYRISFNDGESPAFVSVYSFFTLSVGVWSWDFTDFKQQIQSRIE